MKQHVGAPSRPIVSVGQKLKKGELIATFEGLGAYIHSSVYGEVLEVNNEFVKITLDEIQEEEYVKIKETDNYLETIKEAGIVGAGGAGFPAHVKYNVDLKGGFVILNAAECEPILAHNMKVLLENPDKIVRGIKYAMEITKANKGYIAIKPKHIDEIVALLKAIKNEPNIKIKFLQDMYPSGDERVIIREVLGVELEPGQLPISVNALVSNVETIKRIVEAIECRKPVIAKDFTVGGRLNYTQERAKVYLDEPIGMPVSYYIEDCGGYVNPHGEIVLGGPFTGKRGMEESTITKVLGGIFVSMPAIKNSKKFGILACECGAMEERLREIVSSMEGDIVAEEKCKRMTEVNGRFRCEKPGCCPGQAEKVLKLRSKGAQAILIGTCEE